MSRRYFSRLLERHSQAKLELHYNSASDGLTTRNRIQTMVDAYNSQLQERVLPALKLDKEQLLFATRPVELEAHSTANPQERTGAVVGGLVPYFVLIVCLIAAMYPAIDLAAGEKERGTLETLLLAPVPLRQLVLAKFLVLFSVGMTSALLLLTSLGALLYLFGAILDQQLGNLASSLGLLDLAMLGVMLAPIAAIFAATLLAISIYARNYKEAAGMMQPLAVLILLPIMVALIPGVELNWLWAAVPITNGALAMKELVKGTMEYRLFGMILLSSSLIATALLTFCQWWFSREEVLFRD